jgi:hypothetical protein
VLRSLHRKRPDTDVLFSFIPSVCAEDGANKTQESKTLANDRRQGKTPKKKSTTFTQINQTTGGRQAPKARHAQECHRPVEKKKNTWKRRKEGEERGNDKRWHHLRRSELVESAYVGER